MTWECSFLFSLVEEFEKDWISSSLYVWWNSQVKPSSPGLLLAGSFFITDSVSLLVIGLFKLSISS